MTEWSRRWTQATPGEGPAGTAYAARYPQLGHLLMVAAFSRDLSLEVGSNLQNSWKLQLESDGPAAAKLAQLYGRDFGSPDGWEQSLQDFLEEAGGTIAWAGQAAYEVITRSDEGGQVEDLRALWIDPRTLVCRNHEYAQHQVGNLGEWELVPLAEANIHTFSLPNAYHGRWSGMVEELAILSQPMPRLALEGLRSRDNDVGFDPDVFREHSRIALLRATEQVGWTGSPDWDAFSFWLFAERRLRFKEFAAELRRHLVGEINSVSASTKGFDPILVELNDDGLDATLKQARLDLELGKASVGDIFKTLHQT